MNRLKTLKIIALSLTFFIIGCLIVICIAFMKKDVRKRTDKVIRWWSRKMLKIAHVNYQVFNSQQVEFLPNKSYVIMSNHASHYDIPLSFVAFAEGSIRMIAKKELFRVPLWGKALHTAEFISIDRKNRRQAVKDLQFAREKMRSGIIPWIAPEGTRTRTGEIQPFKKGGFVLASQTEAIIIPMGIRGSGKILPPDTWDFHTGQKVEIHIGEPVDSKDYVHIQELMAAVENKIKNLAASSSCNFKNNPHIS